MCTRKVQCYLSIEVHFNLFNAQFYTDQLWFEHMGRLFLCSYGLNATYFVWLLYIA